MPQYDVLIDSDAFIGFLLAQDAHHQTARAAFRQLIAQQARIVTTNYVVTETASTLSRRFSQAYARQFMQLADNFLMIYITETLHRQSAALFRQQERNKTSMVDIANVVVMQAYDIPQIFAFDKVYTRDFDLSPYIEPIQQ